MKRFVVAQAYPRKGAIIRAASIAYRVFLDELACLYSGRTPAPPVQFAEFARAQHA
ncbi:hypothetical protein ACFPCV_27910 [Actinophytocola glycyrrhizae]|uniref:Transposase n=1 Tax=Actinophytocola glycyrrhizae TaxID=2044873 RepID=A0ABV9SDE3_9PSEU